MTRNTKRCYIHIGLPKTGTSYLQSICWASYEELIKQGVTLLPQSHRESYQLMLAVRDKLSADIDSSNAEQILEQLRTQASDVTTDNVLITQEQLAAAAPERIALLLQVLHGFEVHVIVTVRGISRQIPSAWQERVKTRARYPFDRFVSAAINRRPLARPFWAQQDLPSVLGNWASEVPAERTHIVTVPPAGAGRASLLARYSSVLGIDASRLSTGTPRSNASLGLVQAEVLRRVNVALGERLPRPRAGYARVAKGFLVNQVLRFQKSDSALMPQWAEDWCQETADEWARLIETGKYDIVGDVDDLRPQESDFSATPDLDDRLISESSVEALATVLELRDLELDEWHTMQTELRALRRQVAELRRRELPE